MEEYVLAAILRPHKAEAAVGLPVHDPSLRHAVTCASSLTPSHPPRLDRIEVEDTAIALEVVVATGRPHEVRNGRLHCRQTQFDDNYDNPTIIEDRLRLIDP
ncbi:MAG: hypothetical protein JSU82_02945 [Rhodospirillales bacterium]|nr:MAG: hypothetical protein JSU82_02945 [Rhodospirillales bacterium]